MFPSRRMFPTLARAKSKSKKRYIGYKFCSHHATGIYHREVLSCPLCDLENSYHVLKAYYKVIKDSYDKCICRKLAG